MSSTMKTRVCVIGAGWYGTVAAKTYLQVDPNIDLVVLEAESSAGGTWSKNRVHPYLVTQQAYGIYEYADMPLDTSDTPNPDATFIPSTKLHDYIMAYTKRFGIFDKIRFNTKVSRIARSDNGITWDISLEGTSEKLTFDKVIIATGLTSTPSTPLLDTSAFSPPVFHSKELAVRRKWIGSPAVKRVTVYGGGKSSLDSVYLCVKEGCHVDWVIRPNGASNGPPPLLPGLLMGKNTNVHVATRFASAQHPSLDRIKGFWYRFFHSGKSLGYRLHWIYWGIMSWFMLGTNGYNKSDNMKKLTPEVVDRSAWWINVATAVVTQPEILKWIHSGEKITTHRATIVSATADTITLSDGKKLQTDALIHSTGYKAAAAIYESTLSAELGVPTPLEDYPQTLNDKWTQLEQKADAEVIKLFPRLAKPPPVFSRPIQYTPYRLYKQMLPPTLAKENDRSLVFVGAISALNTPIVAEVMALWAAAWLSGNLQLQESQEEIEESIALRNAFAKRRYLYVGTKTPFIFYEYLPLVDNLLKQLGVNPHRKTGVFADFFTEYFPRDYRGIVEEWKSSRGIGLGRKN